MLESLSVINSLDESQLARYCVGYGIDPPPENLKERRLQIARQIGCGFFPEGGKPVGGECLTVERKAKGLRAHCC